MSMSEEGGLAADTAKRIFSDVKKTTLAAADECRWPQASWDTIEQAGLSRILVPESAGGYGLPLAEGLEIVRLAGESALALPLPETMAANWLLGIAGLSVLQRPSTIAAGEGSVSRNGSHWRVSVRARRIPWARYCDTVMIVPGRSGSFLLRIRAQQAVLSMGSNIAGEPRDDLAVDCELATDDVAPLVTTPHQVQLVGASLRTLQIAGALNAVLRMTIEFVKHRQQFGRDLSAFQVIQHQIALLASATAAANVAGDMAIGGLGESLDQRLIAAAKARAGEAASSAAAIAHQMHGAMGFTRDYDLHTLTRRLWSWRDEFGSEAHWTLTLGRALCAAPPGRFWQALTEI